MIQHVDIVQGHILCIFQKKEYRIHDWMWQKVNIVIETSNVSTHLGYGLLNPHLGMKKMQILCDTYAKHDLDGRTSLLLYCRFGLPLKQRELILSVITRLEPITFCYTGRDFTIMLCIVIRRILFSFSFYQEIDVYSRFLQNILETSGVFLKTL